MQILTHIATEYRPALQAALPEPGLTLAAETYVPGYVTVLEDDTPKDLSDFWNRYDYGVRVLKSAGIVAPWEAEVAAQIAAIKAKWGPV